MPCSRLLSSVMVEVAEEPMLDAMVVEVIV